MDVLMDNTNLKELKNVLRGIKSKIDNCESLAKVLEKLEKNHPIPEDWDCSTEVALVQLYIDLVNVCKQKNIL